MHVFLLGIAGVALLALTACSGSDSFRSERDMALADLATARTDLDDAKSERDTALADLATARADLDDAESERDTALADLATARTNLDDANAALDRANRVRELFGALREGRVTLSGRNTNVSDTEVTTSEDSPIGAQVIAEGTPTTLVGDLMGRKWAKTADGITDTLVLYSLTDPENTGHVHFGWWLREKPDGWQFSEISPIVDGVVNAGVVDELEGTATYTGLAAGLYSMLNVSEGGEFTASATFMADFGDGDAPARVSGRLDDFTGADGMTRADWSVAFTEVGMNPSRGRGHWTNEGDAFWSVGDETSDSGEWRGFFYGPPNAAIFTGRFRATHPSGTAYGYMRGSFGASRD